MASAQSAEELNAAAISAYRTGDYATAETLWKSALDEQLSSVDRARLCYNLGNTTYRQDRLTDSIAWFTSCVRITPRDSSAWNNLEFARREAELEPADRGDLKSTVTRILSAVDRAEAGWMMLICILGWAIVLVLEAVQGGSLWRRLSVGGFFVVLLSSAPLVWQLTSHIENPVMIVETPAAALRTEPGDEHTAVAQTAAGTIVEQIDELGDWVRLQTEFGERGWARRSSVFELQ